MFTYVISSMASLLSTGACAQLDLNKEKDRVLTFVNWDDANKDKYLLARIGFYYIGPTDLVKCYFCNLEIGMWQPEDNPVEEHLKWAPNCPLLHKQQTSNIPLDSKALERVLPLISYKSDSRLNPKSLSYAETSINHPNPLNIRRLSPQTRVSDGGEMNFSSIIQQREHEHPEFALELRRLLSFKDWPKSMKQRPEALVEAGFYYVGRGDCVACFSCGGGLKDWEEEDIPWEQHAMWHDNCNYLKLMKGQEFIDKIVTTKTSPFSPYTTSDLVTELDEGNVNNSNDSKMCKICYKSEYNTVFLPCRHIVSCVKCSLTFKSCPCCRQPIKNLIKIYLS